MEKVLNQIGPFGRYQKLVLVLAGLVSSLTATVTYSTVFTTASPRLICTPLNQPSNYTTEAIDYYEIEEEPSPSTCRMWTELRRNSSAPYECRFDQTYYKETIVSAWGLVCDKAWMVSLTVTINLAGAVSGLFIGFFSDRFGRKRCAFVLAFVLATLLCLWQLVHFHLINLDDNTSYILFCVLQFCCGAMAKSLFTISYILIFELTTSKYTTIASNVFSYMYVMGELFSVLCSYAFKDTLNFKVLNIENTFLFFLLIYK